MNLVDFSKFLDILRRPQTFEKKNEIFQNIVHLVFLNIFWVAISLG